MIYLSGLLKPAEQPMVGQSSYGRQIMEGNNFQNYGGKNQCFCM